MGILNRVYDRNSHDMGGESSESVKGLSPVICLSDIPFYIGI